MSLLNGSHHHDNDSAAQQQQQQQPRCNTTTGEHHKPTTSHNDRATAGNGHDDDAINTGETSAHYKYHSTSILCCYFSPETGAKDCDEYMCLSLCQSVRIAYLKNQIAEVKQIFMRVVCCRGSASSGGVAICYALPVLWLTSWRVICMLILYNGFTCTSDHYRTQQVYFASQVQLSACCSDDWKCLKSCLCDNYLNF